VTGNIHSAAHSLQYLELESACLVFNNVLIINSCLLTWVRELTMLHMLFSELMQQWKTLRCEDCPQDA